MRRLRTSLGIPDEIPLTQTFERYVLPSFDNHSVYNLTVY